MVAAKNLSVVLPALLAVAQVHSSRPSLSTVHLNNVRRNLIANANRSWEIGTMMEAVLEFEQDGLSVFGASHAPATSAAVMPPTILHALNNALNSRPPGTPTFVEDGSVGDPASLGVTDLLAQITVKSSQYATAAQNELNFLLQKAPRNADGVISHRSDQFQVWADFVYMAPPFLAYAGVVQGGSAGKALLQEAYAQCKGYRSILRDPQTGLWRHILDGSFQDTGIWGTGNGWATGGMLRVLATILASDFAGQLGSESDDLVSWTQEILDGAWARQSPDGSLPNYFDSPGTFADSSATAMLAASTFRLASITNSSRHIAAASHAMQYIVEHVDSDGWLTGVVNPYNFGQPGDQSPEGQAFVLLLQSAATAYWANAS